MTHYLLKTGYLSRTPNSDWNGKTQKARNRGYSIKPDGTGLKPLSVLAAQKVRTLQVPNQAPRRRKAGDREQRHAFARFVEAFNRETRAVGSSGRRNQGAIKASGVEIAKELFFHWMGLRGGAFPSHAAIAAVTGWSITTVKRALIALARAGIIHWIRRSILRNGTYLRTSSVYKLGQRAPGVAGEDIKEKDSGYPAPLPSLTETRRNVALALGCNLLG